jgi:MFS transporter, SP family, sugar:H+ symporter
VIPKSLNKNSFPIIPLTPHPLTAYLVDKDHANLQSKVFFIWGGCCLIAIFFVWTMIYETKGLTLEQVDELYEMVDKAWQSKAFRPKINFREGMAEGGRGGSLRQMSVAQEERRKSAAGVHDEGMGKGMH